MTNSAHQEVPMSFHAGPQNGEEGSDTAQKEEVDQAVQTSQVGDQGKKEERLEQD